MMKKKTLEQMTLSGTEEEILAAFRRVRDEIKARFTEYYEKEIRATWKSKKS